MTSFFIDVKIICKGSLEEVKMNQTKKVLIIVAIIFAFFDVAFDIYDIVRFFQTEPAYRASVYYVVFSFISLFASLAIAILLILAIWKNGSLFRVRYGMYMTALVLSIILNLFSVTTVLLVITMFLSDWVWIKPEKDKKFENNVERFKELSKEERIAKLRVRHDNGEISDEEFQEELTKLL